MQNYSFCRDVKYTMWEREYFFIDAETEDEAKIKAIELAEAAEIGDVVEDSEALFDTREYLTVQDNGDSATEEVYLQVDGPNPEIMLWDNRNGKQEEPDDRPPIKDECAEIKLVSIPVKRLEGMLKLNSIQKEQYNIIWGNRVTLEEELNNIENNTKTEKVKKTATKVKTTKKVASKPAKKAKYTRIKKG